MEIEAILKTELDSSLQTQSILREDMQLMQNLTLVTNAVIQAYRNGCKTLFVGNGASAADAQHLSAGYVSRFYFDRPSLPSISLSSDPSVVTAIGNDYGFENLFARQIEAHGKNGDILFALSTSGQSPNILKGIEAAKRLGVRTVGLTSTKGQAMAQLCDFALVVNSTVNPRIQESHITLGHAICAAVEQALFKK